MLAPAFSLIFFICIFPLGYSFFISFYKYDLRYAKRGMTFVGITNYIKVFTDQYFADSMWITAIYVCVCLTIQFLLGLGIALLLNGDIK